MMRSRMMTVLRDCSLKLGPLLCVGEPKALPLEAKLPLAADPAAAESLPKAARNPIPARSAAPATNPYVFAAAKCPGACDAVRGFAAAANPSASSNDAYALVPLRDVHALNEKP